MRRVFDDKRGAVKTLYAVPFLFPLAMVGCAADARDEAVGEDRAPKIIGASDLTPVLQDGANIPSKYAKTIDAFGLIEFEGSNHCTATHVGGGVVLTAGHCFHAPATRKDDFACPGYKIFWGYRADKQPYLTSTCSRVLAAETNRDRDYGIFRVSPVPPTSVKPNLGQRPMVGTSITIFSHPYHRPLEWSKTCTIAEASMGGYGRGQFSHQCDTEPASSGATILDDTTLEVIGIHDGGRVPWNVGTFLSEAPLSEFLVPPSSNGIAAAANGADEPHP